MRGDRNSALDTLRVLVMEDDPSVLSNCCRWLIDEGCEVSTQRTAANVLQCVKRARAEVVLIDPLMDGLSADELTLLLTRCQHPGAPSVILHSRLNALMLRLILDPKNAKGVIRKTENAAEFMRAFRALCEPAWSRPENARPSPAASGTHLIGDLTGEAVVLPLTSASRRRR